MFVAFLYHLHEPLTIVRINNLREMGMLSEEATAKIISGSLLKRDLNGKHYFAHPSTRNESEFFLLE